MEALFEILFDKDQWINVAKKIYDTATIPVEEYKQGQFFCVNALRPTSTRKDENVVCLRNLIFEFDNWYSHTTLELFNKQEQFKKLMFIRDLVPWASLVWSGKKSMHGIISLNVPATDIDNYKEIWYTYQERIEFLLHTRVDMTTKNPSRLTRMPGAIREDTGEEQELMFLGTRSPTPIITAKPKKQKKVVYVGISNDSKERILAKVANATKGDRNNLCFWAANKFREIGIKEEDAFGMLDQLGTLPSSEVKTTVRSAYGREEATKKDQKQEMDIRKRA